MTMLLQYSNAAVQPTETERPTKTVLKLRFSSLRDFWTFAAHSTFARIRGYANGWVDGASYVNTEQNTLSGALGSESVL